MSKRKRKGLVPELRFPEFKDSREWDSPQLGQISERITEKVGERKLTTVSITAGHGFVSQAEKFSRDISGKQYKNYIVLKEGEFSYNKGNSKTFPQGAVYKLKEFEEVAVPNSFVSFRFNKEYLSDFYLGYFDNNYHGRQLLRFITSGARSDGLLNISPYDFFSIVLPTPKEKKEQQKIADCLSSIDDLIIAEDEKLEGLKNHKKGLLQNLFPAEGETVPKVRFPEFEGEGWSPFPLSKIGKVVTGSTPSTTDKYNYGGNLAFVSPADISDQRFTCETKKKLSQLGFSKTRKIPPKSVLFVCIGSTIGKVAQNKEECATNQQINSVIPYSEFVKTFVYYALEQAAPTITELAGKQAVPIINKTLFSSAIINVPSPDEQQKIAIFMSSLDELIVAQSQKVESLKAHKKGLMQQIFPSVDEASI